MIDIADYRQRLATLAEGLDLSEDSGHETFRDILADAFEASPVATLREVARALDVPGPPSSRDGVVECIALAWGQLDPAEQVAPTHTGAEVWDLLADIGTAAADAARAMGDPEFGAVVRRLRSLVEALPAE